MEKSSLISAFILQESKRYSLSSNFVCVCIYILDIQYLIFLLISFRWMELVLNFTKENNGCDESKMNNIFNDFVINFKANVISVFFIF